MTFKADDRVYETSLTTGVGDYTLDGAPTGFNTFAGMGANNTCAYYATDDTNWEIGIGTILTGPARLQRTTILRSSNANAAVNWGVGTRKLRCGLPAAMSIPRSLSKSVAGGANVALTQDEQRRPILIFTGLLTANINVTVDETEWEWTVYNNTTGAYTLTLKTTGGTGKAITQGKSTRLRCDGTNVVDAITMLTSLATGAVVATGSISSASDIGMAASQKFYLDGVALNGDTYISETSANVVQIYAGGGQGLYAGSTGGGVVSGQKLFVDGGVDTYLVESASNVLDVYAGATKVATFASSIITAPNGVKFSATGGETAIAGSKEGSWTAACTGPMASTNQTVYYTRIGKRVTLHIPAVRVSGNSAGAAISISGLPVDLRPVADVFAVRVGVTNSGTDQASPGGVNITTGGGLTVYKDGTFASFTATASTVGFYGFSVTYEIP